MSSLAITGDETGLVKLVDFSSRSYRSHGEQSRSHGVVGMCWVSGGVSGAFATLRQNSCLALWNLKESDLSQLSVESSTDIVDPIGVAAVARKSTDEASMLVCYGKGGQVALISATEELNVMTRFDVQGPVSHCVTCFGGAAFGGRDNDLKLYDLTTQKAVWEAKNVPHDSLRMRVPIWISKMAFMRPSVDSVSDAHILTGTGHKHVRLYDTHLKRQPVLSLEIGEYRVTTILPRFGSDCQVYVGDTSGGIQMWDIRTSKRLATLKGCVGSVRDMSPDCGSSFACVGLDRYVRKFDSSRNKQVTSVYIKNRTNCCLLVDSGSGSKTSGRRKRDDDDEDDDDDDVDGDDQEWSGADNDDESEVFSEDDGDSDAGDRLEELRNSSGDEGSENEQRWKRKVNRTK